MKETIHIYHTNDIHSHFENWPRIEKFLKEKKRQHEERNENVFLFDIGDFADRFHPLTEGTMGQGNTDLLNDIGVNAVTIGNNEGITLPFSALNHLYDAANFDVIVANLFYKDGSRPAWAKPYEVYETKQAKKIIVTGVTTYYEKLYSLLGWEIAEPFEMLARTLEEIKNKEQADMIIVLSHLGIYDDEKIADVFPQVDLVLGSHTHHHLPEGKMVNETILAACGRYCEYVGEIIVECKYGQAKPAITVQTHEISSLDIVENEKDIEQRLFDQGKELLHVEAATIPDPLEYEWSDTSPLGELLCEAIYEWCKADCAIINSGLFLRSLKEGRVTKYDLHQMLPHPINPCAIELTGQELKEIVFHMENENWPHVNVKGLGFRGKVMGKFLYYNIEINHERLEVRIGGKPIDPKRIYRLGAIDMYTFGSYFPEIRKAEHKEYYMPEFLRDVMEWKLQQVYGEK